MFTASGTAWLSGWGSAWLPVLVDATVKGTAVLVIACIAGLFARRASAATRHLVWFLAMVSLLPLIPMAWMTTNFGRRITRLFYKVDNTLGNLSARLQENVNGVHVVRAFAREPHEIAQFDATNRSYFNARLTVNREWAKVMPTTTLLITLGTILILLVGGPLVLQGRMTVGELVASQFSPLVFLAIVLLTSCGEAST